MIQRVVDEEDVAVVRCRLLPAYIDIMLAADNVPAAHDAAGELSLLAEQFGARMLQATADYFRRRRRARGRGRAGGVRVAPPLVESVAAARRPV